MEYAVRICCKMRSAPIISDIRSLEMTGAIMKKFIYV